METFGQRITRLRTAKGWSRPELGRQMATAIGRKKPFSGELVRLYEEDINQPGRAAREALAKALDRPEVYLQFGLVPGAAGMAKEPETTGYGAAPLERTVAGNLLLLIQTFLDTDERGRQTLAKLAKSIRDAGSATRARGTKRR